MKKIVAVFLLWNLLGSVHAGKEILQASPPFLESDECKQKGSDINAADKHHWTQAMCAANWGRLGELHSLFSNGFTNINAQGEWGWTAIMLAARYGYADCVQFLKDHGANMSRRNGEGQTVFDVAYNEEVLRILQD